MKRNVSSKNACQKKPRITSEEFGVLGIIESVSVQNFMCHENLKFDFDPHMNFIIGQNGSGKSAILTAIILALGGKSSSTGRYGNIKGFIKTNKHTATINVTLKNCGPNAYKPEVYGEKITVERILHINGSAQYKIKAPGGHVVSTAKEELRNVLECHGIQIENPTAILTQDISRNFLLTKSTKMLYKLFYEGTNLSKVEDEYQASIKHKNDTIQEIKMKKMLLPEMEEEIKRIKTYLENSEKMPDYKNELLWAGVIELEKIRDTKKQLYEKAKRILNLHKEKLKKYQDEFVEINHSMDKFSKDIEECKLLNAKCRDEVKTLSARRDEIRSAMREYQGVIERHSREMNRRLEEISTLENMVNEIRQKNENFVIENKRQQKEMMEALRADILKRKQLLDNLKDENAEWNQNANTMQQKIDNLNEYVVNLNYKITEAEKEYTQLQKGKNDKLTVYGSEMRNIIIEMNNAFAAGHFRKPPKGPLGEFIQVKNPIWNFAVQCCLGDAILKGFCCDNSEDANKLREIFYKHCQQGTTFPTIFISRYLQQVHNVQAFRPATKYPTLLDLIEITDPVIANCLIDQRRIEAIIMIEDAGEACGYMIKNAPNQCSSAYALNGDQIFANPFRCYPCRKKRDKAHLLKTINDSDICNKKKLLDSLLKERHEKKQALHNAHIDHTNILEKQQRLHDQMSNQNAQLKMKEKKLEKEKEELLNYNEQTDINGMLGELAELQKDKDAAENQLSEIKRCLSDKKAELSAINVNAKKDQLDKESAKYADLTQKLVENETKKANLEMKIKQFESEISNLTSSVESLLKEYKESVQMAKSAESDAKQICPRIKTDRSAETIRNILEEMEKALRKETNCSREVLRDQYEEKYRKWIQFKKELENLELIVVRLHKMLDVRKKKFNDFCKNTALCLSLVFSTTLKKNQFEGDIYVSFEEKELKINARPEKHSTKGGQNYHQLSGGERSFITIAFLLALWDRVEMPFRILDEYDVFMDSTNRQLSTDLLIRTAMSKNNVQFVFLSPLELPPMQRSVDIKIHKMLPPKRKRPLLEL